MDMIKSFLDRPKTYTVVALADVRIADARIYQAKAYIRIAYDEYEADLRFIDSMWLGVND